MARKRILVVDDEYRIQQVIRISLEMMANWEVLTANSSSEGLAVAEVEQPDAILLDLMMPEIDGILTFQQLQANPAICKIPVILMTAKFQVDFDLQLMPGIKGVISKPFDPVNLADQVMETLAW